MHTPSLNVTAIAWLPGPVNAPHRTCAAGFGSGQLGPRWSCLSSRFATGLEHGPETLGLAEDDATDKLTNVATSARTQNCARRRCKVIPVTAT